MNLVPRPDESGSPSRSRIRQGVRAFCGLGRLLLGGVNSGLYRFGALGCGGHAVARTQVVVR